MKLINYENKVQLYELVLSNKTITKSELSSCGFNSDDIKKLVEFRKLKKGANDSYKYVGVKELFSYGKELIRKKIYDKAKLCFIRCLEIEPKYSEVAFSLFLMNIKIFNYEEAFKYLEILLSNDGRNLNDNQLYLYLFSYIIKLPDKYNNWINNIIDEDVFHVGNGEYIKEVNRVRHLILQEKFSLANKTNNMLMVDQLRIHAGDYVIKRLLKEILTRRNLLEEQIKELLKNKNYEAVIKILEEKPRLLIQEEYLLKLVYIYITIEKTNKIPTPSIEYTKDFFVALDRNNFELASIINKEKDDSFSIILNDLKEKIKEQSQPLGQKVKVLK